MNESKVFEAFILTCEFRIGKKRKIMETDVIKVQEETKLKSVSTRCNTHKKRTFGTDITNHKSNISLSEYRNQNQKVENPFLLKEAKRMKKFPSKNIKVKNVSKIRKSKQIRLLANQNDKSHPEAIFDLSRVDEYGFCGTQLGKSQKTLFEKFCIKHQIPIDTEV